MTTHLKEKMYILGAGLFAEEIADIINLVNTHSLGGFIEGQDQARCSDNLLDLPIIWIEDIAQLDKGYRGICAVGSPKRKKFIERARELGMQFATLVHPTAQISSTCTLKTGSIVSAGCIIAVESVIGMHTIVNRGCLIGHHANIGDYVTVSPGANIAGRTVIGDGSYIGMGAIILDGIKIGSNVVVGSGAVVTKDVPDSVQVVGLPARIVKEF